jgi:hypothetical protein
MVGPTISRARMRDLACLGRSRPSKTGRAGLRRVSAPAAETGDLMEPTI